MVKQQLKQYTRKAVRTGFVDGVTRIPRGLQLFDKIMRVLYLYSGDRRPGDLASSLVGLGFQARVYVVVENWDIRISKACDMLDPENAFLLLERAMSGYYAAAHFSPNCRTWSAARHITPGPPPLRSRLEPWGLQFSSPMQSL